MKKTFRSLLCMALAIIMLTALLPIPAAAASDNEKLAAYKVYEELLSELISYEDRVVNGVSILGKTLYSEKDFDYVNQYSEFYLTNISGTFLMDINNDGIKELYFRYTIKKNDMGSGVNYGGVYTYKNGALTKLATGIMGSYIMVGNDGKVYFSIYTPKTYEFNLIYANINGSFEQVANAQALFIHDTWNGLDLPTGHYVYYFNGEKVTKAQFNAKWDQFCGQGYSRITYENVTDTLKAVKAEIATLEFDSVNPFVDVASTDYFAQPVLWAKEKGITTGISANVFGSGNGCTRGQVVTFLHRAAGQPAPSSSENPFIDVDSSAFYYNAVLWAVEKGITTGVGNGQFAPEQTCTRGQIVTFLHRAMGQPGSGGNSNPFKDVSYTDFFYQPVLWAEAKGITSGTSPTTFAPNDTCTRAQVVTFLYRAYKEDAPAPTPKPTPTPTPKPTPTPTPVPTPKPTPTPTPKPTPTPTPRPSIYDKVWVSSAGSNYHRSSTCSALGASPYQMTQLDAMKAGYTQCTKCK